MPTIAELLAAKSGKAAAPNQPGAAAPAAKKPLAAGLTITPEKQSPIPFGQPSEILPRSLSSTSGEDVPRCPNNASPLEVVWHSALEGLNTELCVIPDPDPRSEQAWIAIRRPSEPERPLYLFALPMFPAPGGPIQPF
jgi:hypothetical protein